jgi:hypothetical protein
VELSKQYNKMNAAGTQIIIKLKKTVVGKEYFILFYIRIHIPLLFTITSALLVL